jgi:hypothetical protein
MSGWVRRRKHFCFLPSDFCFLLSAFDLVELNGLEKARFRAPEVQMRADFCLLLSAFCS